MYSLSRNGIADPDFYYVLFNSKNIPPEGQNRGYYANPHLDDLLLQGRSTFDRSKRKPIYQEVQRIIATDLPYISIYMQDNLALEQRDAVGAFVGDGEDGDVARAVAIGEAIEVRHLLAARETPRGPEVQHDDVAAQIGHASRPRGARRLQSQHLDAMLDDGA